MDGFKEFQGKDLDDAIREACEYFNAAREKLEIEIVEDAKSGIFGIVGARKAKVRARRVELHDAVASILGADETTADAGRKSRETARETSRHAGREGSGAAGGRRNGGKPAAAASPAAPVAAGGPAGDEASPEAEALAARNGAAPNRGREANKAASCRQPEAADGGAEAMGQERRRNVPPARDARAAREARPAEAPRNGESGEAPHGRRRNGRKGEPPAGQQASGPAAFDAVPAGEGLEEDLADAGLPSTPLEQLDLVRLEALTREAVGNLVRPIVGGEAKVDVRVDEGRVFVGVDCDADPGLLIGREGQTLAALQYMVSRIVSRGMDAAARAAGRARTVSVREEKLREMAFGPGGKSAPERAFAFHQTLVFLPPAGCARLPAGTARCADPQQRRGPPKRVVIMRRKGEKAEARCGHEPGAGQGNHWPLPRPPSGRHRALYGCPGRRRGACWADCFARPQQGFYGFSALGAASGGACWMPATSPWTMCWPCSCLAHAPSRVRIWLKSSVTAALLWSRPCWKSAPAAWRAPGGQGRVLASGFL